MLGYRTQTPSGGAAILLLVASVVVTLFGLIYLDLSEDTGDDEASRAATVFPYAVLWAEFSDNGTTMHLVAAILQCHAYAILSIFSGMFRQTRPVILGILILHLAASTSAHFLI